MIAEYFSWDKETAHWFLKMDFFMEVEPLIDMAARLVSGDITTTEFLQEFSWLIDDATTTTELTPMYYEEKFKQIRRKYSFIPLPNEPKYYEFEN